MESFLAPNLNAQVQSLCHPQRIRSSPERHCDAAAQESPGRCVGRAIDFPIKPTDRQSYTTHSLNPSFATLPADIDRTSYHQLFHQFFSQILNQFRSARVRKMAEPDPAPHPSKHPSKQTRNQTHKKDTIIHPIKPGIAVLPEDCVLSFSPDRPRDLRPIGHRPSLCTRMVRTSRVHKTQTAPQAGAIRYSRFNRDTTGCRDTRR